MSENDEVKSGEGGMGVWRGSWRDGRNRGIKGEQRQRDLQDSTAVDDDLRPIHTSRHTEPHPPSAYSGGVTRSVNEPAGKTSF